MSYQVLARKWRPKIFREMAGQEHVLKALINALDHNRLHHAYLFTGTRGVGKTTIARILAKCLNCETGISSEPCGTCSACLEIDEGRFVDLIEVDAASRTKVEDTRELLENVQYAPTRGRYKVYLIDEVHMLSMNSFNALLKTLEEPPPHVKFLLATTDPQKLPVTILSRCLQFNLKNLNPERIVEHLKLVLGQEMIEFEEVALWQLGRAADGSMRDALSLTDQAIAFGNGNLNDTDVRNMLGTIDRQYVLHMVNALASQDAASLLECVEQLAEHNPDYSGALDELLSLLHRIALAQTLPESIDDSYGDGEQVKQLASQLCAEDVQLFYQMGINGQRDLPLAPDPRSGFEMVLLRMLAFKPQGIPELPEGSLENNTTDISTTNAATASSANPAAVSSTQSEPPPPAVEPAAKKPEPVRPAPEPSQTPVPEPPPYITEPDFQMAPEMAADPVATAEMPTPEPADAAVPTEPAIEPVAESAVATEIETKNNSEKNNSDALTAVTLPHFNSDTWYQVFNGLNISGVIQNTAAHCVLDAANHGDTSEIHFTLDDKQASLYNPSHQERLATALSDYFGSPVNVTITVGTALKETPAAIKQRLLDERQQQAREAFEQHDDVQTIVEHFGGRILPHSIKPLDH